MDEARLRAQLETRLGGRSVDSYLSNLRRVEVTLGLELDAASLNDHEISLIGQRLLIQGVPQKSVGNCLSALRAFAAFRDEYLFHGASLAAHAAPAADIFPVATPALTSPTIPHDVLQHGSIHQLICLQAQVIDELRKRGVVRTNNNPIGDYAEYLFAHAMNWTLSGNSTSGHDAVCTQGVRYQIKARRLGLANASRQLGAIRKLESQQFEYLAAILFKADFSILRAVIIPHDIVAQFAKPTPHTNSWRLMLDDRLCNHQGVSDVTGRIASEVLRI